MPPPRPKTAVALPVGNIPTPRLGPKSKIRITGSLEDIRRDNSTNLLLRVSPPPSRYSSETGQNA